MPALIRKEIPVDFTGRVYAIGKSNQLPGVGAQVRRILVASPLPGFSGW
jgi:hypothetical protein